MGEHPDVLWHPTLAPRRSGLEDFGRLSSRTTVLLAAAEPLVRTALSAVIGSCFARVQVAATACAARGMLGSSAPSASVLVLDPHLPDASIEDACVTLVAQHPTTATLVLLRRPRPWLVRLVSSHGARGIFDTSIDADRLRAVLTRINDGEVACDPSFVPYLMQAQLPTPNGRPGVRLLTDSQLEMLQLLAEGHSSKEIARALHTSPDAVDHAVERATRRLGASHRTQAVAIALRAGLFS